VIDKFQPDLLAVAAARSAFEHTAAAVAEGASADPLTEALEAYFVTAAVRGEVHGLPAIPAGVPGFEGLARVLGMAYKQSAVGKGQERHGKGRPFDKQPILEIGRMLSSTCDGEIYQIMKKAQEASGMVHRSQTEGAKAELLGVIVYAAAAYLLIEEKEGQ
jgi:hypothetical protein